MKKIIIGITGASGSIYAHRIIEELLKLQNEVHIITTQTAEEVIKYELETDIHHLIQKYEEIGKINFWNNKNLFAPIASGSFDIDAMIIVPCSMGTLAKVSNGISDNLLCRCADVCLKEKRKITLVPRESPLSSIHIENMLKLSKVGVNIVPPMPSFYDKPQKIEDIINNSIGRIIKSIGIKNDIFKKWNGGN
ncbi:UbiX family flavin prenyltransferase [Oceanotoga sp. DSM 15011]|jgi:4-hydroxy-3-polyprenylbenzoate decarboxylase|uniref:Flavin prenyltransferase UbiX n=1 Tax=Oceanotoga teriensis TaxID=515440 RepID=A0AA45C6A5_9BACT|nr:MULTISPECIES: UbiX family flavin prenyltransferase [Oceanotoga]MDN5343491.1 flavin prenyltransferase [Oceanotoga sp.]MDO7975763.1 UbiX family flavin prenyltransferase [Oceanotoga teriensis]PWJ91259.1 4-hydroxy-3-polyprenylbenzoate decarboxylase [Oceanotoga teriensis]UYO99734.1 UbiX family flavin prenyltransferase [Oceanotoga sp. DSM 15011]